MEVAAGLGQDDTAAPFRCCFLISPQFPTSKGSQKLAGSLGLSALPRHGWLLSAAPVFPFTATSRNNVRSKNYLKAEGIKIIPHLSLPVDVGDGAALAHQEKQRKL